MAEHDGRWASFAAGGLRGVGRIWSITCTAALVGLVLFIGANAVFAQDAKEAAAAKRAAADEAAELEEVADDVPAADAPAPQAAAQQPAAASAAPTSAPRQNLLSWMYKALGRTYTLVFLTISFTFVALIVMNLLSVRRDRVVPEALVAAFEAHLNEKRYQEAYELARTDDSFLGRVLSAGLAKLQTGYPEAIEAMQEVGEEETMKLEQRAGYVALIGTISPMFGLLGTVDGMVASFGVIADSATQPKPSQLAEGIEMALVTTLVGLWLAIPAIGLYHFLKNRIARLVLEAGIVSESLMSRFKAGK
ncbi:MAG: MotA/TolQ/ExbB proton channel family protein [Planctomycetia bacterium]|nr:MotA/TolQ/ExbB proton channel family protein [Planctomycetia bacterium]